MEAAQQQQKALQSMKTIITSEDLIRQHMRHHDNPGAKGALLFGIAHLPQER